MAALDPINLTNTALIQIGENPITSFTDFTDVSNAASICWNSSRQFLLSTYPWSFAEKWQQFAQLDPASLPGGVVPGQATLYAYQVPAECIRLNSIYYAGQNSGNGTIGGAISPFVNPSPSSIPAQTIKFQNLVDRYQVKGNMVLCSYPYIAGWYNTDVTDYLVWTPYFGECMVAHMAWRLAFNRAKTQTLQQSMMDNYIRVSATARHTDSITKESGIVGQKRYSNILGGRYT